MELSSLGVTLSFANYDGFACSCPESERQSSNLYQHLNTMHCISLEVKLVRKEGEVLRCMKKRQVGRLVGLLPNREFCLPEDMI